MQIRCNNCHRPFALSHEEVHLALDQLHHEGQHHYTAYCPHCRRANRISPEPLHKAAPDWKQPDTTKSESDPSIVDKDEE